MGLNGITTYSLGFAYPFFTLGVTCPVFTSLLSKQENEFLRISEYSGDIEITLREFSLLTRT
jgi:hypothetical protein